VGTPSLVPIGIGTQSGDSIYPETAEGFLTKTQSQKQADMELSEKTIL
jgi:hypothetical protein